jgi:hypothetical protein
MHRSKPSDVADVLDYNLRTTWTATQTAITQFEQQNDNHFQPSASGYSIV